jgi:hypothetical protein
MKQERFNPSTDVSNWQGRSEYLKGYPGQAMSAALNGGFFGGGEPTWVMEVIPATTGGTHANFYVSSIKTNPYDSKTYVAGFWDGYYPSYDYGPCLGQLAADGSASFEWWWMGWYGSTHTVRATGSKQQISFAPSSSDIYVGSTFERGSTGSMWARWNSSGTLQNACNDYACSYSNNKVGTDGAVVQQNTGILQSYSRMAQNNFLYDANAGPQFGSVSYRGAFSNMSQPSDGATYYTNGGTGYTYGIYNDFSDNSRQCFRYPMNSSGGAVSATISGLSGNPGAMNSYGAGDNTMGMTVSNYPTNFGLLNAGLSAFSWSKTLTASAGSIEINNDYAPHIDKDGNVYAAGKDNSKGFIIKLDSSGSVLWQRHLTVSTGAGSDTSEIRQVGTSEDGTYVYATMYVSSLQYSGSGATKFPRMMVWKIKADGSDSGSVTIDNSSGTGGGDTDVFTIAASSITVNAGSLSIGSFSSPTNQAARAGSFQNDALVVQTPWSGNSNKPVVAASDF